jgi:hypothetical protein
MRSQLCALSLVDVVKDPDDGSADPKRPFWNRRFRDIDGSTQGAAVRRQYPRQRFVDHRYRFGGFSIARSERSPLAKSDAQGVKVIGTGSSDAGAKSEIVAVIGVQLMFGRFPLGSCRRGRKICFVS